MKYKYKILIITLLCVIHIKSFGQTFEKIFTGQWGSTSWRYEFNKDGSFSMTAFGHFGNKVFTGSYEKYFDTIHIISGFENTSGTVNEYYLLDNDSTLIDLTNYYDYIAVTQDRIYLSRKRYDKAVAANSDSIVISKREFDSLVKHSVKLLKYNDIQDFTDSENVQMIRLINTLYFQRPDLRSGIYKQFLKETIVRGYEKKVISTYDWMISRGHGYYLPQLKVSLGGCPNFNSLFIVK